MERARNGETWEYFFIQQHSTETAMLKNKNAVITGGSDGIGLGIARAFAANGANVCLIGRTQKKLAEAQASLAHYGVAVTTIAHDLGVPSSMQSLVRHITERLGTVDILVNNAGIGKFVAFEATDETLLDRHIDLNIKTPYLLTQALLPFIAAQKGNVLNISSYFAQRMLPGRTTTAYSLTKGALNSLTQSLAFEVGKQGVRVNAIAPGSVTTSQLTGNLALLSDADQQQFVDMIPALYPLGVLGHVDDVGAAAVFLASDKAKWITGTVMAVDGGLTTS
ncbi:SDR family NAD(P)-dependent oxidoreductase [Serratia fonticola]|jgi:NAD(P)-dependent dehydrogenase (short-subunit alcohol dehydrogenase family)|uniref:SDR family NAD(P)-dependent oxidoreductase n=2 Tax=Serratia fonticola TaxID=47917 RepID=UPI002178D7B8|nr:SDR family oxidoreductase [Serratia fonticola]CAI1549734.1 3-oxoacyl-[acyl-carrier-protein] reductase FabG [Serratia fonticola]CAI1615613.1 3-oxoacyl-[acyl-carrier-protein] reductase FabG [Serratia fonticola]CAI1729287.1 3-oxoacyl-[acyl-carrier-protein] reductase FabG [Serratia fonticola]CAI1769511.1 3-oxoacyl-[acyl-carrier-protein] reductase FabG [Serratia fonticola]CAI1779485.1 3-oxoacyl-[acyl-carrier-protein] reductase FabG [Serratia fonticola]